MEFVRGYLEDASPERAKLHNLSIILAAPPGLLIFVLTTVRLPSREKPRYIDLIKGRPGLDYRWCSS